MKWVQRHGWHGIALAWILLLGAHSGDALGQSKAADKKDTGKAVKGAKFEPEEKGQKPTSKKDKDLSLEKIELPSGTVIVVCPDYKEAAKLHPKAVILTPTQYQLLQDQINKLKEQIANLKKDQNGTDTHPVVECQLSGRIQGDAARMEASFFVITYKDDRNVFLGCQNSVLLPNGNGLDGKSDPFYPTGNMKKGYTIHIPKAGEHRVTLNLRVPITERSLGGVGTKRTLALGLPVASVTTFEMQFAKPLKEIVVNEKTKKTTGAKTSRVWNVAFAPTDNLTVSWKVAPQRSRGRAIVTGQWDVNVLVRLDKIETVAKLTIQDSRPTKKKWKLLIPQDFTIETIQGAEDQLYTSRRENKSLLVSIDGPPTSKLVVTAKASHERRPRDRVFPIGPFLAQGIKPQLGTFLVRARPEAKIGKYFYFHTDGTLQRRPPDDFPREARDVEAMFVSTDMGAAIAPAHLRNARVSFKAPPQLKLELKKAAALVETNVNHSLALQKSLTGAWEIEVRSQFLVTPKQNGINSLLIELPRKQPKEFTFLSQLAAINPTSFPTNLVGVGTVGVKRKWFVEYPRLREYQCYEQTKDKQLNSAELYPDPDHPNAARIKLSKIYYDPFKVIVRGTYQIAPGIQHVRVNLPRPLSVSWKSYVITQIVDDYEIVSVQGLGKNTVLEKQEVVHQTSQAPASIDLRWQKSRPAVPVTITADVILKGRHPFVRESLRFNFQDHRKQLPGNTSGTPDHVVNLQLPPGVRLRRDEVGQPIIRGGKELSEVGEKVLQVKVGSKGTIEIEYDFPLPFPAPKPSEVGAKRATTKQFRVPLIHPRETPPTQTFVRFWNTTGVVPTVPSIVPGNEQWKEEGPQIIPNKNTLPVLVVSSKQTKAPLTIELEPSTLQPLTGIVVDRTLIQVKFSETGDHFLRARFLVTKLHAEHLDVEFPFSVKTGPEGPEIILTSKTGQSWKLPYRTVEVGGRVVRVDNTQVPLFQTPFVMEVSYKVPTDQVDTVRLGQLLRPPRMLGQVYLGQVKWQITPERGQLPLILGRHSIAPQNWQWEGWLFTPTPGTTVSDLDFWISGKAGQPTVRSQGPVFWTRDLSPVRVTFVPRQFWLLGCSFLVLVVGVCLGLGTPKRVSWWLLATLTVGGLIAVVFGWPSLFPKLLYGAQPGAVILVCVLAVQWLLHRRYRRRVLFLPSFTRSQKGSSITQSGLPSREPSTIDAPARRDSHLEAGNGE